MKHSLFLLPLLGAGMLLGSCSGADARKEYRPAVQVSTVTPYGEQPVKEFPGRVKAAREVNLAFKVAGRITEFLAAEGASVRRDEVVARLDPRDYRLQLEAAEAEYRQIRAQAERVMGLYADSAVTADEYDRARYGLQQIEAKYNNCRNQLSDTELRAPFDGCVQHHLLESGTVVGAGTPVLSFLSGGAPEIEIHIPSATYLRRSEFASFEAVFDLWPDRRIPLTLLSISPQANANQLYTVRLGLPRECSPMPVPGMNTSVRLTFRPAAEQQFRIAATALFEEGERSCVWVVGADSTITRRAVTVERLHSDGSAVVGPALESGERIVTAGVHKLHEGQRVVPMAPVSKTNVGGLL